MVLIKTRVGTEMIMLWFKTQDLSFGFMVAMVMPLSFLLTK